MVEFITIFVHFSVSYLHVLFAYRFYPRRNEDFVVFLFWIMMILWAFMHGFYGVGLLLEEMELYNWIYYASVFTAYSILPFVTALFFPIVFSELTVPPTKSNPLASLLLIISRNTRTIFYMMLATCVVFSFWSLAHLFPLENWRDNYADIKVLFIMFGLGALLLLMLLSGIRAEKGWGDTQSALRVLFGVILLLWVYEYFVEFETWSIGPVVSTVAFSFVFSWYRFRLQFMDMILNQSVSMIMLVVIAIGLEQLVSSNPNLSRNLQLFWITTYLLIAGIVFRQIIQWFSLLWAPDERVLQAMHSELPARLALCETEEAATIVTENFIRDVFHSEVSINGPSEFDVENSLILNGDPVIEMNLGYIRGWIPWLSQANNWARTAALYLQSHLQIKKSHTNLMKAEALSTLAARAELNAMRAQIRPHFLFNTLNSIHSFVRDDPDQAEQVIERLSDLMRSVLTSPDEDLILLEKELSVVSNYLAIEKSRYGERLLFELQVPDELLNHEVPPFSLQPLVENVIKHAVDGQFEPVHLRVEALIDDGYLIIRVVDDGPGLVGVSEGLGIATRNIRDRLSRLYGNDADLQIRTNEMGGVTAALRLPTEALADQGHEKA